MKKNLKILLIGMALVLTGAILKISNVHNFDTIFLISGLLFDAYAIFKIVRWTFLKDTNQIK